MSADDQRAAEEAELVEQALKCAETGNAGHWPTAAGFLADEVYRLRAELAATRAVVDAADALVTECVQRARAGEQLHTGDLDAWGPLERALRAARGDAPAATLADKVEAARPVAAGPVRLSRDPDGELRFSRGDAPAPVDPPAVPDGPDSGGER